MVALFQGIQVSIVWTKFAGEGAGGTGDSRVPVPSFHVILLDREMREARDTSRLILGAAPTTANIPGHLVYVFHESVQRVAEAHNVDVSLVLAHVVAHELGHLLLPAGHHSRSGLMHANWGDRDLQAVTWGLQTFSKEEAALIHCALASGAQAARDSSLGRPPAIAAFPASVYAPPEDALGALELAPPRCGQAPAGAIDEVLDHSNP